MEKVVEKNVDEMSIQELKATAYDVIGVLENAQRNLEILNAQIQKKEAEAKKKDDKK